MNAVKPYWKPDKDMSDFRFSIKKVNLEDHIDVSDVPESTLPFFAFAYLAEGQILFEIEEKSYLCQTGQILIIPQGVPFSIKYFNNKVGYECGFSLKILKDISYNCLHTRKPILQSFQPDEADFTARLMDQLEKAFKKGSMDLVSSILDLVLCRLETSVDTPANATVAKFLNLVFDRNRPIEKVSDYATMLYITPNYLNRLVKANTGHSAMDWIEISRMNLARTLLKRNDMQISDIASAVGIDDQSYFTRFFKKAEGITPSQFRHKRTIPQNDK